jgi:hypothetical protein
MAGSSKYDSVSELMRFIGSRYVFNRDNYPGIEGMSQEEKRAFAVSHSAHHMTKSLGRISAECESWDYGNRMNEESLREATVKMLINTLKLAEELGISAGELIGSVPRLMKSK